MPLPHHAGLSCAASVATLCVLGCARPLTAGPAASAFPAGAGAPSALAAPSSPVPSPTTALAVDSTLAAIAAAPLWPNFEPLRTPVAIWDGTRSWLFRHPAPPPGYAAIAGRSDVVVRDGRDPAITANTSVQLGGVPTATVILDPRRDVTSLAALTTHELFHVFERARHPSWQGNEADLFTYPVDDTVALALRREEWSALRQALAARSEQLERCWGREVVRLRGLRFAAAGAAAAAYERGTELNEGLAQYVERRAAGRPASLDTVDPPAPQVRQRAYAVGAALATLIDRVDPVWRSALESRADSVTSSLDALLADALRDSAASSPPCTAPDSTRIALAAAAGAEVRALRGERARARDAYLAQPGWRVVIEALGAPFFPQGFDPLNVQRLSGTEVLHTRFLKLRGTLGTVDVLDGSVLTEGTPGAHPLFNGVQRVTVAGVTGPIAIVDSAGTLAVDGPGLTARLRGVRADTAGHAIRLVRR